MTLPWRGLLALVLIAAVISGFVLLERRAYFVLFDQDGYVEEGSVLGVRIGDSLAGARQRLRQLGAKELSLDPLRQEADLAVFEFRDESTYNGVISLFIYRDRVIGIQWSYRGPLHFET